MVAYICLFVKSVLAGVGFFISSPFFPQYLRTIMFSFKSSRTLGVGLMLICSTFLSQVVAKQDSEILAAFDQPLQIFGNMMLNDIDFVDGLKVQIYSPTNKTLTVTMNNKPLNGSFVTGTTGEGYRIVRSYSYLFKTNEPSSDLIAKVEIPYDPIRLQNATIDPADTYIAKLADDKKAWMVMDDRRTIQKAAFKTSMSQMTSIDGEYVILGRKSQDVGNIFVPFGVGEAFSVNITGGPGRQDTEFADGLRFAIESDRALRMNVNLKYPISTEEIPQGMVSLNAYAWVVNTTIAADLDAPVIPPAAASGAAPVATLVPAGNMPPVPLIPGAPGMPPMPPMVPPSAGTPAPNAPPAAGMPPMPPMGPPAAGTAAPPAASMPPMAGMPMPAAPLPEVPNARRQAPAVGPEPIAQPDPNAPSPSPAAPLPAPAPGAPAPAPGVPANSTGGLAPPPPNAPPPAPAASSPAPAPAAPPPAPPAAPGSVSVAQIDFPVNMDRLAAALPKGQGNMNPQDPSTMAGIKFTIGRRNLGAAANDRFEPAPLMASGNGNVGNAQNMQIQLVNGRLQFQGVTKLDGEYVILVPTQQGLVEGGKTGKSELGVKKTNAASRADVDWKYVFAVVASIGGMFYM